MVSAKEKLALIGGVYTILVNNGDIYSLTKRIMDIKEGIVVANENSMIPTENIDLFEFGKVGNWTANVEKQTGNLQILEALNFMRRRMDVAFFPGTYLKDFGAYALPTMATVYNGKISERTKQTSHPCVDDYEKLALILGVYEPGKKYSGSFTEPHLRTLQDKLTLEIKNLRKENIPVVTKNGLNILPVICNEIYLLKERYDQEPIDCILHSADGLYSSHEQREREYLKLLDGLETRGKIKVPLILGISEGGESPFSGVLVYNKGKLEQIN